jgi:tRNA threonylcarbamoyladenosine biosynthesis protein TsaB
LSEGRWLLLETSGRVGQVGVARGADLLAARRLDAARRHARDLVPAAGELLRGQGWRARDLDGVIASRGPGSYTGLRVGLIAAKALAYATGCTLLAVDTFAVIARQADVPTDRLEVIADAQQGKLYTQSFRRARDGAWQPSSELSVRPADAWLAGLAEGVAVTGPGVTLVEKRLPHAAVTVPTERRDPQLAALLALGLERAARGERDDPVSLEPLYLRASSAEEQWARRP